MRARSVIIAGFRNGEAYLGTCDLYGTMYTDDFIATGLGAHMALPLLRKGWREDLSYDEARKLLEDSMRVLFYRDTRASNNIHLGKVGARHHLCPRVPTQRRHRACTRSPRLPCGRPWHGILC